ncbi:hypothetical protein WME90_42655 [Sorangium sp. So ce375]|uniref:hypothetical protein n=1 Tax=Sorangium sp. So ce375 TaxID=3133306 RepID=UPI003F5B90D9
MVDGLDRPLGPVLAIDLGEVLEVLQRSFVQHPEDVVLPEQPSHRIDHVRMESELVAFAVVGDPRAATRKAGESTPELTEEALLRRVGQAHLRTLGKDFLFPDSLR